MIGTLSCADTARAAVHHRPTPRRDLYDERVHMRERAVSGTSEGPAPAADLDRPAVTESDIAASPRTEPPTRPPYRAAFAAAPLAMAVVDREGLVVSANDALAALLGGGPGRAHRPGRRRPGGPRLGRPYLARVPRGAARPAGQAALHPTPQAPRRALPVGAGDGRSAARGGARGAALGRRHQRPPRTPGPAAPLADARPGDPAAQPHPVLRAAVGRAGGGGVRADAAPAGSGCATWTSTGSRRSTTPSATASATGCSPPSPSG